MRLRFAFALSTLVATLSLSCPAQTTPAPHGTQTAVALHPDLLPAAFGDWKRAPGSTDTGTNAAPLAQPRFLAEVSHPALEEAGPQRSVNVSFTRGDAATRLIQVTAIEFGDASGALDAFSALNQPDMHDVKGLGTAASTGEDAYLFVSGSSIAVVYPATQVDLPALKALEAVMPKPVGSQALQPLLPTLLPTRGLVAGSVRYATGPRSYMADGGVLPAAGLGWDKEVEAVTAKYDDKRGSETLTLLLYPTPTIAGPHLRAVEAQLSGLGSGFRNAKTRREGQLAIIANGNFTPDAAQALVENTHIHQFASTDKAMPTPELVETRKTFGLFANIILFAGLLGAAAIGVALFLGGGRALLRIIQGKPAATEAEFLSLHLEHQNPAPVFSKE